MLGLRDRERSRMHGQCRVVMIRVRGVHRSNQRDVIDTLGDVRKQRTNLGAALAMGFEFPIRPLQVDPLIVRSILGRRMVRRDLLAVIFRQLGLGVKRINMRYTSRHEQKDDVLGLGWKMWFTNRERITVIGEQLVHDARKQDGAGSSGAEEVAAGCGHGLDFQQIQEGQQIIWWDVERKLGRLWFCQNGTRCPSSA